MSSSSLVPASLVLLAALVAPPVRATPSVLGASGPLGQVAAAPGRVTGQELKAAQAAVDAALQARKRRYESWQKASRARDAAAADVARRKRAGEAGRGLEDALKHALALDEEAARARAALLSSESDVARGGAALLELYDALLVERRRAIEALPARSSARAQAVTSYRQLAAQRDAVRQALLPVLRDDADARLPGELDADLEVEPDDDVESLLEKADLARDLEARFLRQAQAVRRRILELEEERSVARDVSDMVGRSQLFDEEDRRLVVVRTQPGAPAPANNGGSRSADGDDGRPSGPSLVAGDSAVSAPEVQETSGSVPPPNAPGSTGGSPSVVAGTAPSVVVRSEQVVALPGTDTALAGVLASPTMNLESLKALEQKLKARAQAVREKSRKLKSEAEVRGR